MEKWKQIPGWPTYEASDMGRIRRIAGGRWNKPGGVLKPTKLWKGKNDRLRVMLRHDDRKRSVNVATLVAETFLGPKPTLKHQVAHLNGDCRDDRSENLMWATSKENNHHKYLHGTMARGERQGFSKLTEKQVREIRNHDWKWGTPRL